VFTRQKPVTFQILKSKDVVASFPQGKTQKLVVAEDEHNRVNRLFSDLTWNEVFSAFCEKRMPAHIIEDALIFLDDEAFAYFLPGYLLAALHSSEFRHQYLPSMLFALTPTAYVKDRTLSKSKSDRLAVLTPDEAKGIAAFLEASRDAYGRELGLVDISQSHDKFEPAVNYWRTRAQSNSEVRP
jgi:hypothetical protein